MTLTKYAYLEVEIGDGTNATFELNIGYQPESSITKSYIMGQRGQYLREIFNWLPGTGEFDEERGTGYWIDGGAASWEPTVGFKTGLEDVRWGDQSGGDGPSNVTQTDASGADVKAISRIHVLQYWLSKTKTDSTGAAKLHWGEWTDGNIAHISGVSAAAFGKPMPVALQESQLRGPQVEQGDQSSLEGTLSFRHTSLWGGLESPDWASNVAGAIEEASGLIPDS